MRTFALALLVCGAAAAQGDGGEVRLEYRWPRGSKQKLDVDLSLELKMDGTETAINFIRSSAEFFSFEKIHLRAEGERTVLRSREGDPRVHLAYASATVEGRYDDQDFSYRFERGKAPDGDKLRGILWLIFLAGKTYSVRPDGDCEFEDKNQDATGEVLDLISHGLLRLPDVVVSPGAEWEKTFETKRIQKDNRGRFEIVQKSKLEKVERGKAHIASTFTGRIVLPEERSVDPNVEKAEAGCEGECRLVFDAERGEPVSSESKGKVRFYYKGTDPNGGGDHELEIQLLVEAKITSRQ